MPAIPVIAAVGAGIAAATSVTGTIISGVAGSKAAKASEAVGASNAAILRRRAENQRRVMGFELGQFDEQAGRFVGAGDLAAAGAGIETGGSVAMGRRETIQNLAADRENLWAQYDVQIQETLAEAAQQEQFGSAAGDIGGLQTVAGALQGTTQALGYTGEFLQTGQTAGWWG